MRKCISPDEETLERLLVQMLAPEPPSESLRRAVRQQVRREWERQQSPRESWLRRWLGQPLPRWAPVAAALIVMALMGAVFLAPGDGVMVGTAVGEANSTLFIGGFLVLCAVGLVFWWRRRH